MIGYLGKSAYEDLIAAKKKKKQCSAMYTQEQAEQAWKMYMGYTSGSYRRCDVMETGEIAERLGIRRKYVALAINEISRQKMTEAISKKKLRR